VLLLRSRCRGAAVAKPGNQVAVAVNPWKHCSVSILKKVQLSNLNANRRHWRLLAQRLDRRRRCAAATAATRL
jgi:hypothetical protein